jgi:hypothetical protein
VRHVCALLAAIAVLAVAGCGDEGDARSVAPKPTKTPSVGFPQARYARLDPGEVYVTQQFRPVLTLVPSPGQWRTTTGDGRNHVELEPQGQDVSVVRARLGFHHMKRVFDPARGGRSTDEAVDGPPDFSVWLAENPHLRTTEREPVRALGLTGVRLDVRYGSAPPLVPDSCGAFAGECVPMWAYGDDVVVMPEDTHSRFYVLDQPGGGQLVVEESVSPASAFDKVSPQLDATLRMSHVPAE